MIYPTARAAALAAAGVPLALLAGAAAPGWWLAGPAWAALIAALSLADAGLGPSTRTARVRLAAPANVGIARGGDATVSAEFDGGVPRATEVALEADARLGVTPHRLRIDPARDAAARFVIAPRRRGPGRIERAFARWPGPLGLVWKQVSARTGHTVAVTLDVRAARETALRLRSELQAFGTRIQGFAGPGSEFHALTEFRPGLEPRAIDWKRSARHLRLLAREHEAERNHTIALAVDTGRLMGAPVDGIARLDHALNAALALGEAALRSGDRVGFFAFDARPGPAAGPLVGARAFDQISSAAAAADLSGEETNFTLAMASLSQRLSRRALVVVFTEFADPTSAERMIESAARMLKRHLVLFIVQRDRDLEALVDAEPDTAAQVAEAVVAGALLRERRIVIERLRRLGARVLETDGRLTAEALVARYLDLRRQDAL